ncbi:Glycoside hydrolase family 9 protein [Dioscorea alata]|uniref:Glycoside hydrolase family 9 protein n=1 Tax=Dioscorea alata TaxID=55571 RepID=A0ACB7VY24_DIOAL|nr:Glycoside hydrolase family 9 protein [Dioscorea alata]
MAIKHELLLLLFVLSLCMHDATLDYHQALSKSILYFEAQRSGKLPANQRVQWRGDSALNDGADAGVDLVGGYYDSGDNVKFGFPMAYTVTMLAWSAIEFGTQLHEKNELSNAQEAIKWGTDYLLKAHAASQVLYVQVGDGYSDHACWERPEDMTTPRNSYRIDNTKPGSDVAAESSAALAASSIVFQASDKNYANKLLTHAKQLFEFGHKHVGLYSDSIQQARGFYPSSGYDDELLWAASWLHRATGEQVYLDFLANSSTTGGKRTLFSWDDKFVGVQTLVSKLILEGKIKEEGIWGEYKKALDEFVCSMIQKGNGNNVKMSPGGMLWWQPWNNFQYTTSAMLVLASHSSHLATSGTTLHCPGATVSVQQLISFLRSQVNYILGANPKNMSYMVGFSQVYPGQVHHRAASIVSIKKDRARVTCNGGFDSWYNRNAPNPNVIDGAVVGGPDAGDSYTDSRSNYQQAEPATVTTAPLVGVLAMLA